VREVIDIAQSISKTSLSIISEEIRRFQEIPEVVADISLAKSMLGWGPKYTFEAGLKEMMKFDNRDSKK
jgi:UDP-glucose 4-epimerase